MKIYNRKGFFRGIVSVTIGILAFITLYLKGFSFFSLFSGVFLFLIGITEISRSFSKTATLQDKLQEEDERDFYVELKAGRKAFEIIQYINVISIISLIILFGITKKEVFAGLMIIPGLYFTINVILKVATFIYYEKKI